jgi:hypothetical protein
MSSLIENDNTKDQPNGFVAGLVRGMGRFPQAIAVTKRVLAHKIVGQIPKKVAVQKVGRLSDVSSYVIDLWSNFRDASDGHDSRKGTFKLFRSTALSMARSTLLGTSAFVAFEKVSEIATGKMDVERSTAKEGAAPYTPSVWILSSICAGSSHAALGITWDTLIAREKLSKEAVRAVWASSVASHLGLFTAYFATKTALLNRLNCDTASPAGIISIIAAGSAAGAAAYVGETLFPDAPAAPAPATPAAATPRAMAMRLLAESLRRGRQLSMGAAMRAMPATAVAFLAFEFAEAG